MQNRIMDATIALLDEMEPEGVSIRKIADQAQISHMVIYSYFKDRDALLKALIHRFEERTRQRFDRILTEMDDGNILLRLRSALEDYIQVAKSRPRLFRLMWILPVKPPTRTARRPILFENQMKFLAELFKKGMDRGIFAKHEPEMAALTILGIINAPILLFNQGRMADVKMRDRVIDENLDIVIRYIVGK